MAFKPWKPPFLISRCKVCGLNLARLSGETVFPCKSCGRNHSFCAACSVVLERMNYISKRIDHEFILRSGWASKATEMVLTECPGKEIAVAIRLERV